MSVHYESLRREHVNDVIYYAGCACKGREPISALM